MPRYTAEQRRAYAEHLHSLIHEWIEQGEGDFEIELKRGVEWCPDARTQDRRPRANHTMTLVLTVNGGAEDSEGPPVVQAPGLYGGPGD
jgi:hypothetical protein